MGYYKYLVNGILRLGTCGVLGTQATLVARHKYRRSVLAGPVYRTG